MAKKTDSILWLDDEIDLLRPYIIFWKKEAIR